MGHARGEAGRGGDHRPPRIQDVRQKILFIEFLTCLQTGHESRLPLQKETKVSVQNSR